MPGIHLDIERSLTIVLCKLTNAGCFKVQTGQSIIRKIVRPNAALNFSPRSWKKLADFRLGSKHLRNVQTVWHKHLHVPLGFKCSRLKEVLLDNDSLQGRRTQGHAR